MDIVVDWLLDPLALLFLLSLALGLAWVSGGAGAGRRRGGRGVAARRAAVLLAWVGCFLTASAPAIVNPLVDALESRHPVDVVCPVGTPLVVLGGGVDTRARSADEFERMRPATLARTAAAERLARAEPAVPLLLSGGGLAGDASRVSEADVMARLLVSRGIDPARLVREVRSGDTAGNARESAALLARPDAAEGERLPPVRLVTSALHMPRALAVFRAIGFEACPVPVRPIALEGVPPWALMPQTTALAKFDELLHELVATAVYRLRGDL